MTRARPPFVASWLRGSVPGFSMLETSVAVALLGIGLIMVAAIFPVALSQHQSSADQASAIDLSNKALAITKARVNTNQLYFPPSLPSGVDSPLYLLPTTSIAYGLNSWDPMYQGVAPNQQIYANLISGFDSIASPFPGGPYGNFPDYLPGGNQYGLAGNDYLDTRETPYTDSELQSDAHHFVWYGFYRRMGTGAVRFTTIVCKQRRGAVYAEQDMSLGTALPQNSFNTPGAVSPPNRRLPVPWRVSVGYDLTGGSRRLSNRAAAPMFGATGAGIGALAPAGSRLMIQGTTYENGVPAIPVPTGRLLTVANVVSVNTIDVLEDISELPPLDFTTGTGTTFDVWLVPPAVESGSAGKESPALVWRTTL